MTKRYGAAGCGNPVWKAFVALAGHIGTLYRDVIQLSRMGAGGRHLSSTAVSYSEGWLVCRLKI
jgi:hypothetical protein